MPVAKLWQFQQFAAPVLIIENPVQPDVVLSMWAPEIVQPYPARRSSHAALATASTLVIPSALFDTYVPPLDSWSPTFPVQFHVPPPQNAGMHQPASLPFQFFDSLAVTAEIRGAFHIADAGETLYELFIGQDDSPDLGGAADDSGATPSLSATVDNDQTYHVVVRQTNVHGITSINRAETVLTIGTGEVIATPPSPPYDVSLRQREGGKVQIRASYAYAADGAAQADTWAIYLTTTGVNPDPSSDSATTVTMNKNPTVAGLIWTSTALADAADVRVLVRARRASDSGESTNTTPVTLTNDAGGPDFSNNTRAIGGDKFEQSP